MVDAAALFYPAENELAVAFYPEKLSADERMTLTELLATYNIGYHER